MRLRSLLTALLSLALVLECAIAVHAGDISVLEVPGRPILLRFSQLVGPPDAAWWLSGRRWRTTLAVVTEDELHRVTTLAVNDADATVIASFGGYGAAPGRFNAPAGAAVDPTGRIWVSDTLNDRLQVFSPTGRLLMVLGPQLQLRQPGIPAVDDLGRVYVPDTGNNRIIVLDSNGRLLTVWGRQGRGPGEFHGPAAVAVTADGSRVYVADRLNQRVQVLNGRGRPLGIFREHLVFPWDVGLASEGQYVYAVDSLASHVVVYAPDGRFIREIGGGHHGSAPGFFFDPQGIAVDSTGRLWVFDNVNHRVQVLNPDGTVVWTFGQQFIGTVPRRNSHGLLAAVAGFVLTALLTLWIERHSRETARSQKLRRSSM